MSTSPHILLVDDDREIRDLLSRFLDRHGLRVTAARDGREARRAWTAGHYSMVILDIMLPGESGLDIARWLRTISDVPILMLTAMGDETDRIIGLELGADDYLPKPFNPRELLDLLRGRQAGPFDRAIDVAISRLRRKLNRETDDAAAPSPAGAQTGQLIKTVRGGGYVFACEVERE